MPDDLLGTLQPPPPAITTLSPLGQFGAGLAGMAAGMRGQPNPVLGQIQAQQNTQFQQQVQMLQLRQAVQAHRRKQGELQLKLGEDFLKIPEGRLYGAKMMTGAMEQMGVLPAGMSPSTLEGLLGKQPLDDRTLQAVAQDFELFPEHSDVTIAQRRGIKPQEVTDLRAGWGNKTTRRLLFPKLAEAELKETEFEERRADRKAQLAQQFLQFQENLDLKRHIIEGNMELRRTMMGFQRDKTIEKDLDKRRTVLTSVIALEDINGKLSRALTKMHAAGALPDKPGFFSDLTARVARHTTLKNDPDVMYFLNFGSEQGVGMARTFQKDVGTRSIAPFLAMIHTMMNPGPLQSMLPIVQQWQAELAIAKKAAMYPSRFIGPQEVQELEEFYTKLQELTSKGVKVHGFKEVK